MSNALKQLLAIDKSSGGAEQANSLKQWGLNANAHRWSAIDVDHPRHGFHDHVDVVPESRIAKLRLVAAEARRLGLPVFFSRRTKGPLKGGAYSWVWTPVAETEPFTHVTVWVPTDDATVTVTTA